MQETCKLLLDENELSWHYRCAITRTCSNWGKLVGPWENRWRSQLVERVIGNYGYIRRCIAPRRQLWVRKVLHFTLSWYTERYTRRCLKYFNFISWWHVFKKVQNTFRLTIYLLRPLEYTVLFRLSNSFIV